ncbi:MAG: cystathionine beta-lyase [Alphaproteobacteria bacterium]
MKKQTRLLQSGHTKDNNQGYVNPPIYKGSTVTFDTVAAFDEGERNEWKGDFYGLISNPTQRAFEEAICELEGANHCIALPSGLAAISVGMLSFVQAGEHVLVCDAAYGPTSRLSKRFLARMGVDVQWYPADCTDISPYIKENTKVIYIESPASLTMEMADIRAICDVAKQHKIITIYDNTWSAGLFCDAFDLGVDVTLHAGTKFVGGHSDILMGMVSTKDERLWKKLKLSAVMFGYGVSSEDCWLALRGLRSLHVRLKQHQETGLKVANWLAGRDEVQEILYPAHPNSPYYHLWQRDFSGSPGLFSIILKDYPDAKVDAFLNRLKLFRMGVSWGGYDSLISRFDKGLSRQYKDEKYNNPCLRLHCGLEDADDLIADLSEAFKKL